MIDTFYIGAYWRSRSESLELVTNKILHTLSNLGQLDLQFLDWYELGTSRKGALEKRFPLDFEHIRQLCLKGVKKEELDQNGFSNLGFLSSLWSGHKESEACKISFNAGASSERLNNCCVLNLPYDKVVHARLLELKKVRQIMKILIDIWDPDFALLTSHELNNVFETSSEIGWFTYRKSVKQSLKLANKVIQEEYSGGRFIYLNTDDSMSYDYNLVNDLKLFWEANDFRS